MSSCSMKPTASLIFCGQNLATTLRRPGKTRSIQNFSRTWTSSRPSRRPKSGSKLFGSVWQRGAQRQLRRPKPVNKKLEFVMFELDQLVSDCRAALKENAPQKAVQEVVARAVANPREVLKALGEPQRAEMQTLYHADDLTILNVIWAPWMNLLPHNHQMWAIIGLYTGREDNIFWRRVPGNKGLVEAVGARALREKDAEPLGRDIIHSVSNPIPKLTGALHVYGGDFFHA